MRLDSAKDPDADPKHCLGQNKNLLVCSYLMMSVGSLPSDLPAVGDGLVPGLRPLLLHGSVLLVHSAVVCNKKVVWKIQEFYHFVREWMFPLSRNLTGRV